MLSFFSKKKQSPETPPGDVIKGPSDSSGEEFIIVDNQQPAGPAIYPQTPAGTAGAIMPLYPYPPAPYGPPPLNNNRSFNVNQNPVPYLLGIPFNLAPQLSTTTTFEVTQMEVDGILALMTKQMQFETDYDFKLEREILSECYW